MNLPYSNHLSLAQHGHWSRALVAIAAAAALLSTASPARADGPGISQSALNFTGGTKQPGEAVATLNSTQVGSNATIADFQYGWLITRTNAPESLLKLWDISNPASPVQVAAEGIWGDKQHATGFWLGPNGEKLLTAATNGSNATIYQVNTGASPVTISYKSQLDPNGVYPLWAFVQAPYVFRANSGYVDDPLRLNVFNVSNPTSPVRLTRTEGQSAAQDSRPQIDMGSYGLGFSTGSLYVVGNLMVASASQGSGAATFNVSNPVAPVKLSSTTAGGSTYAGIIYGTRLFQGGQNDAGMDVYDFSDPNNMRYLGSVVGASTKYTMGKDRVIHTSGSGTSYSQVYSDRMDIRAQHTLGHDSEFIYPIGNLSFAMFDGGSLVLTDRDPDNLGPLVEYANPAMGATNQPLGTRIGMCMSDQVDVRSLNSTNFRVRALNGSGVPTGDPIPGTYSTQMGGD